MPDDCPILDCCSGSNPLTYEVSPSNTVYLRTESDPEEGGTTTGDGNFEIGDEVTVTATPEIPTSIDVGVDIVFALDESPTMIVDIQTILTDVVTRLEADLLAEGIGSGTVPNRYGAVQFGRELPAAVEFPFQNSTDFLADVATITGYGGGNPLEDAYDGIDCAITQMPWRTDLPVTKIIFFMTDEDRNNHFYADGADQDAQFITLKAKLVDGGYILAGMHNCRDQRLADGDSVVAMAADYTGNAYLADGAGSYTVSTGAQNIGTFSPGDTPVFPLTGQNEEYFDLLMDTEVRGYFFDLVSYRTDTPQPMTTESVLDVMVPILKDRIVQELVWTFVGWFNEGGELVSSDLSYTFNILNNTVLTARFIHD